MSPSFLAAFFLLAAGLLGLGVIFNRDNALSIRIGLLSPDRVVANKTDIATDVTNMADATGWDAALIRRVIEGVQYYGKDDCEIMLYTDETQLKQDVAAHKLECGYAFNETGVIRAYRSPMTVADKVLDLLVAAAYMETMAGELGAETLHPYLVEMNNGEVAGLVATEDIAADIQSRADAYLRDGALMEILPGNISGDAADISTVPTESSTTASPSDPKPAPYRRLFHGLLGLFALLLSLLCAMGLADDTQKAALARIKATGRGGEGYQLAGFGVILVAVGSFIALTLSVGAVLYPGLRIGWREETLMTFAYAWALAGIAACLSAYVRTSLFPALLTFVFIFAALLGGVFFDLREIWADVAFLRFGFPNYYYADGISRGTVGWPWPQAIGLMGMGLTAGALAVKSGGCKR